MATTDQGLGEGRAEQGEAVRGPRRWPALLVVCFATLLVSVDFMAVAVSLPTTGRALSLSYGQLEWVLEAPVVVLAASLLLAGHFVGSRGRRPVFISGLAIFGVGAALAGSASSPYVLITGRGLQGVGAACLYATASLLLSELFGRAPRRGPLVTWTGVTAIALAGAPFVGGVITYELGWRWLYFVSALAAALSSLLALLLVPEPRHIATAASGGRGRAPQRADWRGFLALSSALLVLTVGLVRTTSGPALANFTDNGVIACFIAAALLLIIFVALESLSDSPLLPMAFFARRTFTGGSAAALGLSAAILGPFLFLVLYLAYVPGASAFSIGLRLLLLTGATVAFLPFSGLLGRLLPAKLLIFFGLAAVATGLFLMSRVTVGETWSRLWPGLLVAGIGVELVNPRLALVAAAGVEPGGEALAARASSTFRHFGTAAGVAAFGSVFANRITNDIYNAIPATKGAHAGSATVAATFALQGHLALAARAAGGPGRGAMLALVRDSMADALHLVLIAAACVAAASALISLVVRSRDVPRRHDTPPVQLATEDEAMKDHVFSRFWAKPQASERAEEEAFSWQAFDPVVDTPPAGTPAVIVRPAPPLPTDEPAGDIEAPDHTEPELSEATPIEPVSIEPVSIEQASIEPASIEPASGEQASGEQGSIEQASIEPASTEQEAAGPVVAEGDAEAAPLEEPRSPGGQDLEGPERLGEDAAGTVTAEHQEPSGVQVAAGSAPVFTSPGAISGSLRRLAAFREAHVHPVAYEQPVPSRAHGDNAHGDHAQGEVADPLLFSPTANVEEIEAARQASGSHFGGPLIDLTAGCEMRGTVTDSLGNPLPGATVTLVGPEGREPGRAISAGEGEFSWGDLSEGTYTVVAGAPGYRTAALVLTCRRGQQATAAFSLSGIGSVTGRVSRAKDGAPVEARVELLDQRGAPIVATTAGADGEFVLADLLEGDYQLVVTSDAFAPQRTGVSVRRGSTSVAEVGLRGLGYLYGAVTSGEGAWVAGIAVNLIDNAQEVVATTSTDSAGGFHFTAVPEGRYTLSTSAGAENRGTGLAVEIDAGQTISAELSLQGA